MFCIVLYSVYVLANQVPLHAGAKRFHLQTSLIRDNNETAVMAPQGPGQGQDRLQSPLWRGCTPKAAPVGSAEIAT